MRPIEIAASQEHGRVAGDSAGGVNRFRRDDAGCVGEGFGC